MPSGLMTRRISLNATERQRSYSSAMMAPGRFRPSRLLTISSDFRVWGVVSCDPGGSRHRDGSSGRVEEELADVYKTPDGRPQGNAYSQKRPGVTFTSVTTSPRQEAARGRAREGDLGRQP